MKKYLASMLLLFVITAAPAAAYPYNLYIGGTHSHTSFSDGAMLPENAWDIARNQGKCDFWFITDHYQSLDTRKNLPPGAPPQSEWDHEVKTAHTMTVDGKFLALNGWEWYDGKTGHINVLFTEDTPPPMLLTGVLDRFISYWIKKHPGELIGFNHPTWSANHKMSNFNDFKLIPAIASQTVYIEVEEPKDFPHYFRALDNGWNLAPVSAQDNHAPNWGLDPEFTGVYADSLTADALYEAFVARRFYASTIRTLRINFEANGRPMGSRLALRAVELVVTTHGDNGEIPAVVRIVTNRGAVVREWKPESADFRASVALPVDFDGVRWFVALASMTDGHFSISAPVWVQRP